MAVGLLVAACSTDSDGGRPSESFYADMKAGLLEGGLSPADTDCVIEGMRDLDPTATDMAYFEENDVFSDELTNEIAGLAVTCLAPSP